MAEEKKTKKEKITGAEKKQHGPFKKRRGGVVLTKDEVKEIKAGRKKLRKDMKAQGIRSKKEFELTASGLGLYFDKNKRFGLLLWFLHGRALWALLGALLALLGGLFLYSHITQMKGHFTINMGDDMFEEGFLLSEDEAFTDPQAQLYSDPVLDAPCISISTIPEDVDDHEGNHSGEAYFAYTFFLKNEGKSKADYSYEVKINSESRNLSTGAWVMVFMDGEMTFYARANSEGEAEALPSYGDDTRGYRILPWFDQTADPEKQYEAIASTSMGTYYRIIPEMFEDETTVTSGVRKGMKPGTIHKYTVVIWLEGDDPDCTDELIGGHLGVEMNFKLLNKKKK